MDKHSTTKRPHVLMFPLPAQGHVNSMLKLAELLCLARLDVTFLMSNQKHSRLLTYTNFLSRFSPYVGFRVETLPDYVFDQNQQPHDEITNMFFALENSVKPFLLDYLVSETPVTCLIADGIMSLANDLALELCIPVIYFRTVSACGFWANFWIPEVFEAGELPLTSKLSLKHLRFNFIPIHCYQ